MRRYTVNDYDIFVGRDRVTKEYVAIVKEFPSLSWVSEVSRPLAAQGMRSLLTDVLDDLYADDEVPPTPRSAGIAETQLQGLALA